MSLVTEIQLLFLPIPVTSITLLYPDMTRLNEGHWKHSVSIKQYSDFLDGLLEVFFIGQVSGFLETGGMEAPSYGIKVFTLSTGKREEDDNCQ